MQRRTNAVRLCRASNYSAHPDDENVRLYLGSFLHHIPLLLWCHSKLWQELSCTAGSQARSSILCSGRVCGRNVMCARLFEPSAPEWVDLDFFCNFSLRLIATLSCHLPVIRHSSIVTSPM